VRWVEDPTIESGGPSLVHLELLDDGG